MGNHGRIVGGVVTAAAGVRCHILGNEAGVPTLVRVGIDFIAERKLRLLNEKFQAITVRLQRLQAAVSDEPSDRQVDILHRLEERRNRLAEQMADVAGALDAEERAQVEVDGTVHRGVRIQVCRSTMTVEEQLSRVRFRLDKESGRVVNEPLETDGTA